MDTSTNKPDLLRQIPTGGKLNATNQPIVVNVPAIRAPNTRKPA